MALHDELLAQAIRLPINNRNQAGLRRAVSAAYYALFHLLVSEAVERLSTDQSPALRALMRRAFGHAGMLEICRQVSAGGLSKELRPIFTTLIEDDLVAVAKKFVGLQEARLTADYDLEKDLEMNTAKLAVISADQAFRHWTNIKHTPNATVFLTALLLGRHWKR